MSEGQLVEDPAELALRQGLRAEPLSNDAMQRIRAATEAEWRVATNQDQRATARASGTSGRWRLAAAAALAVVSLAVGWQLVGSDRSSQQGAVLGQLQTSPSVVNERLSFGRTRALASGAALTAGQDLQVVGNALVTLPAAGTLRLAAGTRLKILAGDLIELQDGLIYLDILPSESQNTRFVVKTTAGEFMHLGTQFTVMTQGKRAQVRVREGSVVWRRGDQEDIATAGTSLLIDGDGTATRESITTTGREWAWVEALAPEFDIESRPLAEFLAWVARETGRKLVVADTGTEQRIAATILHGSISGLTSLEALSTVIQTTALHFDLPEGEIRVSSAGGSPPVSK